jgi:regulator of cell morphogenesis and NO signaling
MSELELDSTLAAIVRAWPATAAVLRARGIDFCCRGELTLGQACVEQGVEPEELLGELRGACLAPAAGPRPEALATPALLEHLVGTHHAYLRRALPWLGELAAKVARVHGGEDLRLLELQGVVDALRELLPPHLEEEERRLFPALLAGGAPDLPEQLEAMRAEHLQVGRLLLRLRALSDGFAPPEWACPTYRVYLSELERLEEDTLRHVHTENHVLAPRFAAPRALEETAP